jgi:hypothetical protein
MWKGNQRHPSKLPIFAGLSHGEILLVSARAGILGEEDYGYMMRTLHLVATRRDDRQTSH